MIFLDALKHTLKVLGAALYWLLTIVFIWAGLVQMGTAPGWGWGCIALVLALFAARGLLVPRVISAPVSYLLGCAAFFAFMAAAWTITGYRVN